MRLFGWDITRSDEEEERIENQKSITPDQNDGSIVVDTSTTSEQASVYGGAWGYSMGFDIDPDIISEQALITKYRELSLVPEIDFAIDDIFNAMAATDENDVVEINLDDVEYSIGLKNKITEEFDYVLNLLDFNMNAYEIIRRWYVDGRLYYQVIVDEDLYKTEGISKLTYIDPRLIKKVRLVKKDKDEHTGVDVYSEKDEYYIFSETGFGSNLSNAMTSTVDQGVKITKESIAFIHSGLFNPSNTVILSYLHKAIRPLNQLKNLEDASIIYRLSRAPERRVFYIDVGNLPAAKAEQVLQRQMQQYRNKMVYDSATGTVRSDPKQMTMIEDYWLPRRGDGKSTEITTLPGGQNLGEMDEINYFLQKLYKSLNVPVSRLDPQAGFNFGRVTEINRDEVKFMKFIGRLRKRFSNLFLELLKRQLALKNILNPEEFDNIRHLITFDFKTDSIFEESKQNEVLTGRFTLLQLADGFVGKYFSKKWIDTNILHISDEEREEIDGEMEEDGTKDQFDDAVDANMNMYVSGAKSGQSGGGGSGGLQPATPGGSELTSPVPTPTASPTS